MLHWHGQAVKGLGAVMHVGTEGERLMLLALIDNTA